MAFAWLHVTRQNSERAKSLFAEAEAECVSPRELAYVLYLEQRGLLWLRDPEGACQAGRRCVEACRAARDNHLLVQALITAATLCNVLGREELARAYTVEACKIDPRALSLRSPGQKRSLHQEGAALPAWS